MNQSLDPRPLSDAEPAEAFQPGLLVMVLLAAIGFVVSGIVRVTDTLLPPIAAGFDAPVGEAAVIIAAFGAAFGIFTFIHGGLGDWLGKLKVIACAGLAAGLATLLCATAGTLWELAGWRFLVGATVSACIPLSLAYIGDNVAYERRQAVLGRYMTGIMLGQIAGAALGGALTDLMGWRQVFVIYGAITMLAAGMLAALVFSGRVKRRQRQRTPPSLANYTGILRNPKARYFYLLCLLEGVIVIGVIAFIGALMRDRFALSYGMIGMLLAGYGFGGLIYAVLVKMIVAKVSEIRLVLFGGGGMAAVYGVFAVLDSALPLFVLMVLLGFSFYTFHIVLQVRATEISAHARGAAMSFFSFSLFFGQSLGALLFGWVIDGFSYAHGFALAALLTALLALQVAHGLRSGALARGASGGDHAAGGTV